MSAGTYGIEEAPADATDVQTCGTCGKRWVPDITPAGRCPWEWMHDSESWAERPVHHVEAKVVFADGTEAHVLVAEGTDMSWGASTPYLADTLALRAAIHEAYEQQWGES